MVKAANPTWENVMIVVGYGNLGTKRWTCRYCDEMLVVSIFNKE